MVVPWALWADRRPRAVYKHWVALHNSKTVVVCELSASSLTISTVCFQRFVSMMFLIVSLATHEWFRSLCFVLWRFLICLGCVVLISPCCFCLLRVSASPVSCWVLQLFRVTEVLMASREFGLRLVLLYFFWIVGPSVVLGKEFS